MLVAVGLAHVQHLLHGGPGGAHEDQIVCEARRAVPLAGDVAAEPGAAELAEEVV